jgi:predicted metal-dependent hydrolase
MNLSEDKMFLLNHEVEVIIDKKRIKNIYFRINDEGNIYVTCPILTSNLTINRLLSKNVKSLERMYKSYLNKSNKKQKVMYLGKEMDYIEYKKVMINDGIIYGPSVDKINEYLEKHSLSLFEERMQLYINEFPNIPKFRLRIRKMKTRWGVNNFKSKTITLNTELIHYRYDCIDYVIIHELSHFYHKDHSRNFWNEVGKHFPRYKEIRKELRY